MTIKGESKIWRKTWTNYKTNYMIIKINNMNLTETIMNSLKSSSH